MVIVDRVIVRLCFRSLYGVLRLYVNFFQPSQKLISKKRSGGKVIKKYDQAKTPDQRVLAPDSIPEEVKTELRELYQGLDPVTLFWQLEFYQGSLWQYAWRPSSEEMRANEVMKEQQEERTVPELPTRGAEGEFARALRSLLAMQWENDETSFSDRHFAAR